MSTIQTIEKIKSEITRNDHKLIIITGTKNTHNSLLEKLQAFEKIDCINLNLHLSKILISKNGLNDPNDIIENLLSEISTKDIILFSNINILFDSTLKWNPMNILKNLSCNHMLIVFWDGEINGNNLQYAVQKHSEFRQYPIHDLTEILIIETNYA